jgi:hypothetical protein
MTKGTTETEASRFVICLHPIEEGVQKDTWPDTLDAWKIQELLFVRPTQMRRTGEASSILDRKDGCVTRRMKILWHGQLTTSKPWCIMLLICY